MIRFRLSSTLFFGIVLVVTLSLATSTTSALRLTKVSIPAYKKKGESALLECKYELRKHRPNLDAIVKYKMQYDDGLDDEDDGDLLSAGEALYSVKWYKDNEEFYRYLPKSNPPQHSYRVEGIRVDHQYSDSTKVTLRGLTIKSSGQYRCEISAEAPSFDSVQGEGKMTIVYLPKDGPHITGEERQYQIGDLLSLNCSSGKSHPASSLSWYINDKLVINPDTLIRYPYHHHPHGLITTTLGLEVDLETVHFRDGEMRVKCVANVSPVLWQGDMENVVRRRLLENREAMLLVRSDAPRKTTNIIWLGLFVMYTLFCNPKL